MDSEEALCSFFLISESLLRRYFSLRSGERQAVKGLIFGITRQTAVEEKGPPGVCSLSSTSGSETLICMEDGEGSVWEVTSLL